MNQNIITYLNENKEKYSKEVLVAELQKGGYAEGDIADGVAQVFEGKALSPAPANASFWNFKDKKTYTGVGQKWADFLFGFFAPMVGGFVLNVLSIFLLGGMFLLGAVMFVLWVVALVYLFKRRRFMFYGMIVSLVVLPIIIFLFIIAVFSRHGF